MKKRLWKRLTAFIMACVVTGTVSVDTVFASGNENNIAASIPQKVVKNNNITKNRKSS